MKKSPRAAAAVLLLGLLAVSLPAYAINCLWFPLSCLKPGKKFGEEIEGQVLDIRTSRTEHYEVGPGFYGAGWSSMENTRTWYVWFKVSNTLYQSEMTQSMYNFISYKPKREDWIGKNVKLRFLDKNFMGFKTAWVHIKRPDGKEWETIVVSIVGPNGVDECNSLKYCKPQAEVDRLALEAEQLAALQKAGAKSAADVAPAPVEIPDAAPANAPAAASAAADAPAAAAPAEAPAPAAPAEPAPPAPAEAPAATTPPAEAAPK